MSASFCRRSTLHDAAAQKQPRLDTSPLQRLCHGVGKGCVRWEWPIGRIGEGDTEKSYSRYHSKRERSLFFLMYYRKASRSEGDLQRESGRESLPRTRRAPVCPCVPQAQY